MLRSRMYYPDDVVTSVYANDTIEWIIDSDILIIVITPPQDLLN